MTQSEDPKVSGLLIIGVFVALLAIAGLTIWANATGEPSRESNKAPAQQGK